MEDAKWTIETTASSYKNRKYYFVLIFFAVTKPVESDKDNWEYVYKLAVMLMDKLLYLFVTLSLVGSASATKSKNSSVNRIEKAKLK